MHIVVSVLAFLFGVLHIFAAVVQLGRGEADGRPSIIMFFGGVAVTCASLAHLSGTVTITLMEVAVSFLMICLAAYVNGRQAGKVHPSHHIVRGAVAVLLTVGFLLW